MTPDQLITIMPQARNRAGAFSVPLADAMSEFEINTPLREAAFLAQIAHESGQLRYVREVWGPTAAQSRYEGRKDLGNTQPGDGSRFRGRGLTQITGRSNYWAVGEALGVDFIASPELLESVENACRSAAWFWKSRQLNELADQKLFGTITRRINGGLNGQAERLAFYEVALKTMEVM